MRVNEWHTIIVQGRPVNHDLEPAYYRKGKTNVRIDGIWYCVDCDDIVDMRALTDLGFRQNPNLHGKYTSMYQKDLRFKRKPRLSDQVVKKIRTVEQSLPEERDIDISTSVEYERNDIVSHKQKEKYPGTARNARCPCGSGKKYKRCCGANLK